MKKIIGILLVIIALLAINSNTVFANFANVAEEKCDESCVEKVLEGKMSRAELEYIGYGNVIRAATEGNGGDITSVLYQLGLWHYLPAGNVNAVFETNIPMEAYFFNLCEDGAIWAGKVDKFDHLTVWLCYPNEPCTIIIQE